MSLLMTDIPALALAEGSMISTSAVVANLERTQTQAKIQDYLKRSDVQKALIERGVSPEEASLRLASLSQAELRQLSAEVEYAQAGGDILVTILVIVLIIFLIKRI
jgi:hypothetical protein